MYMYMTRDLKIDLCILHSLYCSSFLDIQIQHWQVPPKKEKPFYIFIFLFIFIYL